mgnify:CR=1 FL=1
MKSKITDIFREFFQKYTKLLLAFIGTLIVEGAVVAVSVLSVLPLADYLVDPTLSSPNYVTQKVIDILKIISIEPSFIIFGSIFVFLNLIKAVSNILIRYILLKIKYVILQKLTLDTLHKFFDARWGFFSKSNQGLLINTLNKELTIIGDTVGHLALIASYFFQLLFYLITPMIINYKLTLTTLIMSLIFLYPLFILNNLGYRFGQKNTSTANANTQTFTEIFQAAKLIIGFGNQTKAKNRYENTFNAHVNATIKSQTLTAAISIIVQPLIIFAAIISIGFIIDDKINIPELSAVFWSLMAALPLLGKIVHGRISISNFIPSYEQLNLLRTNAADHKEFSGTKSFERLNDKIEFKNVSFKYPGRYLGLNNCNILFKKKKVTAITGKSGSGKTTISDLILGLQKTNKGKVLIDNIEINDFNINNFRHKIGYVPQESFLFNTSIENNLLWAINGGKSNKFDEKFLMKKNERDVKVQECLRLANIDKFIDSLPDGIKTEVGDRGTRLSGGQKQRISLARALIRDPEILILDEATSSIDDDTEKSILSSLNKLKDSMTIILIAHRLSTLSCADEIYVLDQGEIVESGSFQDLSSNKDSLIFDLKNSYREN